MIQNFCQNVNLVKGIDFQKHDFFALFLKEMAIIGIFN